MYIFNSSLENNEIVSHNVIKAASVFAASVAAAVVSAVLLPHPAMDSAMVPARIIDKSFPVFFIIALPVLSSRFCNCSVPSQSRAKIH